MDTRSLLPFAVLAILMMSAASAVTVESEGGAGTYGVGDTFTVTADYTFTCTDEGASDASYNATILDAPEWINVTGGTVDYVASDCITGAGSVTVEGIEINVTVTDLAPAFTDFELQPGLVASDGTAKDAEGGNFTIQQDYVPSFDAPSALGYDVVGGGYTATIPLATNANADSIYSFEVTSFTFDGAPGDSRGTAHIQSNLTVEAAADLSTVNSTVDLHFGDHIAHDPDDSHDDGMEMEGGEEADDHDDVFHWSTAQVNVAITLAAVEDDTLTSEVHNVALTFTNTDPDTMPHADMPGNDTAEEEDGGFLGIPGYEAVAAVAALGAVAALRRRR